MNLPRLFCLVAFLAVPLAAPQAAPEGAPQGAPQGAKAAARVLVRVGEHPGYSRLVFDWDRPVGARLENRPGGVTVHFDRVADLDLARYRADPPLAVSDIQLARSSGGLAVSLTIAPGVTPRLSRSGGKVILDVPGRDGSAGAPAPKSASKPPRSRPARQIAEAGPRVTKGAEVPGPAEKLPEGIAARPGTEKQAASTSSMVSIPVPPILVETSPAPGRSIKFGTRAALRFQWPGPVAAALFRRGPYLWLVFDQTAPGDPTAEIEESAPELAPVARPALSGLPSPKRSFGSAQAGGTVIRLTPPPVVVPSLRREGTTWIVDFWSRGPRQGTEIPLEVVGAEAEDEDGFMRVLFPVTKPGRAVSFIDPELGDRLTVIPVMTPGLGLAAARNFTQFRALASQQGLVLQEFSEGLQIKVSNRAVRVGHRDGLVVSQGASLAMLRSNPVTPSHGPRLFDLTAWRRGDSSEFRANKQALQMTLVEATAGPARVARVELARLYFAHGLTAEARGVLRIGATADGRPVMDPETRLMAGVGAFMAEDYAAAARDLFHPMLAGEWEAELWQAAMAAVSLDWSRAAAGFSATEELIEDYPRRLRTRLRLLAAEARLGIADPAGADHYLEQIRRNHPNRVEEAQVAYFVGRRLQLEGDPEGAEELWQRVAANGRHAPSQTRARLGLLDLHLENGSISAARAVAELERLRVAWRGDHFEIALLERLGDLYLSLNQFREGLGALRQAALRFPRSQRSRAVTQRMRQVFAEIYLGADPTRVPPLRALALYEEFKELTPAGPKGEEVIARLAERLVEVDLLERAAEILESQVKFRLRGLPRARVGRRLAQIRLLDGQAEKSIEALDLSAARNLPPSLARQRRYLRTRALTLMERHSMALALLAGDDDPEALRLRADVLWQQRDWSGTARILEGLTLHRPPTDRPLTDAESQALVRLAVALTLAAKPAKLRHLGRTFGSAMAAGPYRETFALLVGDLEPDRVKSIAEELAQVEQIESFMSSYRKAAKQTAEAKPRDN